MRKEEILCQCHILPTIQIPASAPYSLSFHSYRLVTLKCVIWTVVMSWEHMIKEKSLMGIPKEKVRSALAQVAKARGPAYLSVFTLTESWSYSLPQKGSQITAFLVIVPRPFFTEFQEASIPGGRHVYLPQGQTSDVNACKVWPLSRTVNVLHVNPSPFSVSLIAASANPRTGRMSGSNANKGSSGVVDWLSSACRFASDRNDFRRWATDGKRTQKGAGSAVALAPELV